MIIYRTICTALLHAYPKAYWQHQQAELIGVLLDRMAHRRKHQGFIASARLGLREATALVVGIPRAWLGRMRTASGVRLFTRAPWLSDIGYAVRCVKRHRMYSAIVVATLAMGIGVNTAIFSVVNSVLLRPLEYQEPEKLGLIWNTFPGLREERTWVHDHQIKALRQEAKLFEGFAAMRMVSGRILGGPQPIHTDVARVSSEFFDLLGVAPHIGRTFTPSDDDYGAPWVAVLSHAYWTREFNQDPGIIGRELVIGFPYMKIVGVLPENFDHRMYEAIGDLVVPEIWIPHQIDFERSAVIEPGGGVAVLARVRNSVSPKQATAELNELAEAHAKRFFGSADLEYEYAPLLQDIVREVRPTLLTLLGAVGFVLLIAISNITTLAIGRAQARHSEYAVRNALGASTWRVVRGLFAENAVLAAFGGLLGIGIAILGTRYLLTTLPFELPRSAAASIDIRVLTFFTLLAMAATVVPATVHALYVRKINPERLLRGDDRGQSEMRHVVRTQGGLVVVQIVLSVVLLMGATLAGRSFLAMRGLDPGFNKEGVLTFSTFLMQEYETAQERDDFFEKLARRIGEIPDVIAVGATTALPLSQPSYGPVFTTEQQRRIAYKTWPGQGVDFDPTQPVRGDWLTADINAARPGYFEATGIPLVAGREFLQSDGLLDPPHVVVDETLAAKFWPGQDAVGKRVWVFNTWATIVGVARHTHHRDYGVRGQPQLYIPYAGVATTLRTSVVVRTNSTPTALIPEIRAQIASIDPMVPIADIETLENRVVRSTAHQRFLGVLMVGFAAIALFLAALGIYGVLAITVGSRRREIAVRVTMGAPRSHIAMMVALRAAGLATLGGTLGLSLALFLGSPLDGLFFGIRTSDAASLLLAILGLFAITFLAAWAPVRRAATVDPQIILKSE